MGTKTLFYLLRPLYIMALRVHMALCDNLQNTFRPCRRCKDDRHSSVLVSVPEPIDLGIVFSQGLGAFGKACGVDMQS